MITLEKCKLKGSNSQEIKSEEKQNYVQQKDENEKLIQLLEHIKGIQKEQNYDEFEE